MNVFNASLDREVVAGDARQDPRVSVIRGAEKPRRIGMRYEVIEALGQGGMAQVYQVHDAVSGKHMALKQLLAQSDAQRMAQAAVLFEREYHTLAQLSHPRVIEVYDYGVDELGSFYTMELLDGGDLRERSPMPYRQACHLLYDVCSSLALLHARRLLHRDVSPRNIRCTQNGRAKLIDFGAMVPMGAGAQLVGTPPFVAPEVVHGSALDARADLYSLGATLYFALTGRQAYAAANFSQLFDVWAGDLPPAPSRIVPEIPEALDRLVMSLLSLEPARRPRSAFEVMQRLAALAGIEEQDAAGVSMAYLSTPVMVGRAEPLDAFNLRMRRALRGRLPKRYGHLLIAAPQGLGRSRMLDACALEAKTLGATVLRAGADAGAGADFSVAQVLIEQVLQLLPEPAREAADKLGIAATVFEPPSTNANDTARPAKLRLTPLAALEGRPALQDALASWLLRLAERHALWIAVDDVDRVDEASVALLATLAHRSRRQRLLLTATSEPLTSRNSVSAFDVLAGQCEVMPLRRLDQDETERLFCSVFGDVQNIALLSARIHANAAGNPRQCMALAQHLVDQHRIVYQGGHWTLPEQLSPDELPASEVDAIVARLAQLPPLARKLIQTQALSLYDALDRDDFEHLAPTEAPSQIDAALGTLIAQQVMTSDGKLYRVAHRAVAAAVRSTLDDGEKRQCHRALATLYERTQRPDLAIVRELFLADLPQPALSRLLPILPVVRDRMGLSDVAKLGAAELSWTMEQALVQARRLECTPREICEVQRWLLWLSIGGDEGLYWQAVEGWVEQVKRDSGLTTYRELTDISDANQRLMTALQRTVERYNAADERTRVYAPDEAIRMLVQYVVVSIVVGARTQDTALVLTLPELLEPFAPLSPLMYAIWQNALATRETTCYRQYGRARDRWVKVLDLLDGVTESSSDVQAIRNAVAFGVGTCEATMGLESALRWAELLDKDAGHRVNAMYLRKVMRLQQGDLEGAEQYRKQAEVLAVTASSRQMFTNLLSLEIIVHAAAWDLTGVQQIAARIEPLADKHRGWEPFRYLARAQFERLRGDLEAACVAFRQCLALSAPDPAHPDRSITAWSPALSGYAETLVVLDRAAEAKLLAQAGLEICYARDMHATSHDIARALALAEAKLGAFDRAFELLDSIIEQQRALGVTGLSLGASYEARARVAIWAGDRPMAEHYGQLVAEQFRNGSGSTLGARYERLMQEARGSGMQLLPQLSAFETAILSGSDAGNRLLTASSVADAMHGAIDARSRAERALRLLCESRGVEGGHLYLVHDGELSHVAAFDADAPDVDLREFVLEFWTRQFGADEAESTGPMPTDEVTAHRTLLWTDPDGKVFQPVLLTVAGAGALIHVGVAVLVMETLRVRTFDPRIAAELAGHLMRAGDTSGLRSN